MYLPVPSIEKKLEAEIAILRRQLNQLGPVIAQAAPVYSLEQKNVIRGNFNGAANRTFSLGASLAPRRRALLNRLDYSTRRLNALRVHRVHAAGFSFAA